MTERLRVVCDTNVFLSAFLSKSTTGPTRELIERWKRGEFDLLICEALEQEIVEKLHERGIRREAILELVTLFEAVAGSAAGGRSVTIVCAGTAIDGHWQGDWEATLAHGGLYANLSLCRSVVECEYWASRRLTQSWSNWLRVT